MLDSYYRKANNATVLYMESIVKSRINKTVHWLTTHEEKEEITKFSIGKGRSRRKFHIQLQKDLQDIKIENNWKKCMINYQMIQEN